MNTDRGSSQIFLLNGIKLEGIGQEIELPTRVANERHLHASSASTLPELLVDAMPMASPVPWRCLVTVAGLLCVVFPVVASTGGRQSGSAVFGTAEGLEYSSVPSSTCSVKISLPK